MTDPITLAAGQVFVPKDPKIAPREIQLRFTDACGQDCVRWIYPGFPNSGSWLPIRSFETWARKNRAEIKETTDG